MCVNVCVLLQLLLHSRKKKRAQRGEREEEEEEVCERVRLCLCIFPVSFLIDDSSLVAVV